MTRRAWPYLLVAVSMLLLVIAFHGPNERLPMDPGTPPEVVLTGDGS